MDLKKLSILKDKLVAAKNFKEPWNYFFDNFAEDLEFLKLGKLAKDTMIKEIITKIGEELFGTEKVSVTNFFMTELKKYHFFHGACFIQGRVASVIFFADIDMGLIAVSMGGTEISLIRFSSIKIEGNKEVFFVPNSKSNTIN